MNRPDSNAARAVSFCSADDQKIRATPLSIAAFATAAATDGEKGEGERDKSATTGFENGLHSFVPHSGYLNVLTSLSGPNGESSPGF